MNGSREGLVIRRQGSIVCIIWVLRGDGVLSSPPEACTDIQSSAIPRILREGVLLVETVSGSTAKTRVLMPT